ncbi:MAG TPA: hypothetical protein DCK87_04170 [Desulfotomaculum sp.]|nr:hypothetical protein [Desulfotomaculum sp.]
MFVACFTLSSLSFSGTLFIYHSIPFLIFLLFNLNLHCYIIIFYKKIINPSLKNIFLIHF